jgi:hypothetical protein
MFNAENMAVYETREDEKEQLVIFVTGYEGDSRHKWRMITKAIAEMLNKREEEG